MAKTSTIEKNKGRTEIADQYKVQINSILENANTPAQFKDFDLYCRGLQKSTIRNYMKVAFDFHQYLVDLLGNDDFMTMYQNVPAQYVNRFLWASGKEGDEEISNATYNARRMALSKYFKFLISINAAQKNPVLETQHQNTDATERKQALNSNEIKKLLENVLHPEFIDCGDLQKKNLEQFKLMWYLFIQLGLNTGARFGELTNLSLDDIDEKRSQIRYFQKGDKVRFASIHPEIMELIKLYLEERKTYLEKIGKQYKDGQRKFTSRQSELTDALFISPRGYRISEQYATKIIRLFAWDIDKPVTTHTLRHSFATNVYEKTHDIRMVQDLMGHASIKTTQRYVHIDGARAQANVYNMFEETLNATPFNKEMSWK